MKQQSSLPDMKVLTSPVKSSQSAIPKLKTSAFWSYGLCSMTCKQNSNQREEKEQK
jgi:hypothetical protein